MGILNRINMYKCKIFIIVVITTVIIGCNKKTDITNSMDNKNVQKVDYIINTNLSSRDYSDIEGYFPKEGLVPTMEIAFQIAEPILHKIYGKEHIEKEKTFLYPSLGVGSACVGLKANVHACNKTQVL
jgi:hypothetical protein